MSVSSSSSSCYRTSLPTLQHLMLQAPLLVSTPVISPLLDPYSRGLRRPPTLNGSTSSSFPHQLSPPPLADDSNSTSRGSSSSYISSSVSSSSSVTGPNARSNSSSTAARPLISDHHHQPDRGAPLSRRANACHSCRLRKTRCVPINDQQFKRTTISSSSSSSSPSRSRSIAPCTRCFQSGVPCEYYDTREDNKARIRSQRRYHNVRHEQGLGHGLVPTSSSRPLQSTFQLNHRDSGRRPVRMDGDHIGDNTGPLSVDEAIADGPSSFSRHSSWDQDHSWSNGRKGSPSNFITKRPREDHRLKTTISDP